MTDRTHTVARAATFAGRLAARWKARAGAWTAPEMTLRRTEPALARTVVQRLAPTIVSHQHLAPRIHIQLAVVGPGRGRPPGPTHRASAGPVVPRAAAAAPPLERLVRRAAFAPTAPPPRSPVVLRRVTLPPAQLAPDAASPVDAVAAATTARREERERIETVVRRTRIEAATTPPAPGGSSTAPSSSRTTGDVEAAVPGPRRPGAPPMSRPLGLAEVEIARLADRVVERIQRRATVQRERMGGR